MNYLFITLSLVLLGTVIYQFIKNNKLNSEMLDYKVKYQSIKAYVEETTNKTAHKTEKADKTVKRGRKPKK